MTIEKASNAKASNIKMVVYGKPATQKTRFACNGIKKGIILDLEKGLGSTENIEDLDRVAINTAQDFAQAIQYLSENPDKYETVIIDSMTAYGEKLFLALSDIYPEKKDGMNKWGDFDTLSRKRYDQIIDLKMNVIMIFLEDEMVIEGFNASYPLYKAKKFTAGLLAAPSIAAHAVKDNDGEVIYDIIGNSEAVAKNRFYNELKNKKLATNGDIKTFQELIDTIQS